MLVAFRPGSVWLSSRPARKVSSSSHFSRTTSDCRRYATTPPPKLVAPSVRKARKISRRLTRSTRAGPAARATSPSPATAALRATATAMPWSSWRVGSPTPAASLIVADLLPGKLVVHRGLRRPELDPGSGLALQEPVKPLGAQLRDRLEAAVVPEVRLVRELPDHDLVGRGIAPDGHVDLRGLRAAEAELAQLVEHLLHGDGRGGRDLRLRLHPEHGEAGKHLDVIAEGLERRPAFVRELAGVREDAPHPAELAPDEQDLLLELDAARDALRRVHVDRGGAPDVRVPEFERELVLVARRLAHVRAADPQHEGVPVEIAARRVEEDDVAVLRFGLVPAPLDVDQELRGDPARELPVVVDLGRDVVREVRRLQQDLELAIVDRLVEIEEIDVPVLAHALARARVALRFRLSLAHAPHLRAPFCPIGSSETMARRSVARRKRSRRRRQLARTSSSSPSTRARQRTRGLVRRSRFSVSARTAGSDTSQQ